MVRGKARVASGYNAAHHWLAQHAMKTGACSRCGHTGKTEWAFLRWPEAYTKDSTDYAEMCRSCHQKFDIETGERPRPVPPSELNRLAAAKTHCKRGHLFDEENTYVTRHGRRKCKKCQAEYLKAYKKARKNERC